MIEASELKMKVTLKTENWQTKKTKQTIPTTGLMDPFPLIQIMDNYGIKKAGY